MKNTFRKRVKNVLISGILPVAILLLWEFSVRLQLVPNSLVASPSQVVQKFYAMLLDGRLLENSYVSMRRLLLGFILGTTLGITVGIVVGFWKLGERIIE